MLEKLKITFKVFKPNIDETPLPKEKPQSLVKRISLLKAEKAYKKYKKHLIIAADTILYSRKKIFHKTEDRAQAYNNLKLLSGRRHIIFTGLTIIDKQDKKYFYLTKTKIKFKVLNENDINKYLTLDEWKNKTGSYAIQGYGAIFINFLVGSYSGAIGLPLEKLQHVLKEEKIL
ncbi:MAG: septum formation protein Maf [Pelagibacterales bacterium]|nr:septum formation protein Maf [Pelagibacterales bacterium]OUU61537.1 MAG: septum formation protein Maf [Alphaproteobacteria bacterium TMED62]|tara:strand:+ start:147 stop:668 length:522 start_codon:yes stop_codon:yes gene_type:complete